jgi:hypothetical protein
MSLPRAFQVFFTVFAFSFASAVIAENSAQNSTQNSAQNSAQPTSENSKVPSDKALSTDYSFKIKAHRVWTDTGLDLNPGDRIHVTGAVTVCEVIDERTHLPLPSAPDGALLIKLDADTPPILASPDADLPIINRSQLYLGVNGFHCRGTVPVTVHVDRHKPDQSSR